MADRLEEKHRKDLILRLKRVEGQLRGLQKMIETGDDCEKVGQQMADLLTDAQLTLPGGTIFFVGRATPRHAVSFCLSSPFIWRGVGVSRPATKPLSRRRGQGGGRAHDPSAAV